MCMHIGTCAYTSEIKLQYIKVTICKYKYTKSEFFVLSIVLERNSKHLFTVLQE